MSSRRNLLSVLDLSAEETEALAGRALELKNSKPNGSRTLEGCAVGIYFSKTSTRTRTSFTVGAARLGATPISYGPCDLQINTGESLPDTARVLAGYLDALVVRTAGPLSEMKELATQPDMPVINAMSAAEHPTQALADMATLLEIFGHLQCLRILYIGEGNNTASALALALTRLSGIELTLVTPPEFGLAPQTAEMARKFSCENNGSFAQHHSMSCLPKNVDAVYTTRWQTTGAVMKNSGWLKQFEPFIVTAGVMSEVSRPSGTVFLHDLPAHRGEDVTSEVLDGPQSIAFEQARNKLYGAMAVLEWCILGQRE